ncbi:MAG TPA: hypothetical protein VFH29_08600, partial [Anaerolineales bacterium]|nr:hypothetical protein [Anaerolineales bacterium]
MTDDQHNHTGHASHDHHADHGSSFERASADHAAPIPTEHVAVPAHTHAGHTAKADHTEHTPHADHASHSMTGAAVSEHSEHGALADHTGHEQMFRRRFWVSLALSVPVLLFSMMIQELLGFRMPTFAGSEWIPFVFSLLIFAYGGVPFLRLAMPEIRNREPGMMTLISLAISVALIYSLAAQVLGLGEGFFWELVTLIDIMLLGHWLEMRSVRQASGALNELARLMPDTAELLLPDGATRIVPARSLKTGDEILVRPGSSIPADGEVTEGESSVNESMVTGESKPVDKIRAAKLIAGTINGDGSLRMRVTATGDQTALAGIMRLVEQA